MPRIKANIYQELKPFSSVSTNVLEIQKLLVNCATILDVGCGSSSNLRFLQNSRLTGADVYAPDLERAKSQSTHDDFILCDIK